MKLPDFTKSEELNFLKKKMGIAEHVFGTLEFAISPGTANSAETEALESDQGLDVQLSDIRSLEDGTLSYKNRRIILYIRDKHDYGRGAQDPRFHIANCPTLRWMQTEGRIDRYVSYSKDDGNFKLNIIKGRSVKAEMRKLDVCQNCLDFLRYRNFSLNDSRSARHTAVSRFEIRDFFSNYPKIFPPDLPRFSVETAPLDIYPPNFGEISHQIRKSRGWKCEGLNCGVDFSTTQQSGLRRYLHVHHRDGQKSDNREANLQALCLHCHANQPLHSQLKATLEYKEFAGIRNKILGLKAP